MKQDQKAVRGLDCTWNFTSLNQLLFSQSTRFERAVLGFM
jgi:hypothetical protein